VAGVAQLTAVAPSRLGRLSDAVLAAAHLCEVDRLYRIGGAQGVGALAFGTASIAPVDKIVGPGNRYVATAKRLLYGRVGIDMVAGPSEVVIVADSSADAEWLVMDLFAQAEHDEDAQAILISPDPALLRRVERLIGVRLQEAVRRAIIRKSLQANGALIRVTDFSEALALVNEIAPEHLELAVADPERLLEQVQHAGAIFLGSHSAEVLGDYSAGPSHVLPTTGTARFSSPLGVYDFQKRSSVIKCTPRGALHLARTASVVAKEEGLDAHRQAADYRITNE
jgi:histidinol dehydrogenase